MSGRRRGNVFPVARRLLGLLGNADRIFLEILPDAEPTGAAVSGECVFVATTAALFHDALIGS